ncbi:response regulator [Flagellimonas okinawensis]|uniref:Response regulator transcription factor n=1 Tax=Flagellimonas okinawensis TaxID=3031324 RepID=A0ABT5XIK0_9FLAO|nr:response regulator transcription factor [[Muricauda] okinawensis]MDF0705724.1 response regulator transcription factor [[Muricauda] okinawensis]
MISVLIADDHMLFRQGIAAMLGDFEQLEIIGQAANGQEALDLMMNAEPDVLLLDIEMPEVDGFQVLKELKKKKSITKVLVLTMHHSGAFVQNIVSAGADGYLKKDSDQQILLGAIEQVHKVGSYFPPETTQMVIQSLREKNKQGMVTPREKEVILLIVEGLTTREIAERLHLSKHTVESHRQNILLKLELKNSAELVRYALKKGWA